MLQALRTVLVFSASALLYCANDQAQCFTAPKGIATVVVAAGVFGYAWASPAAPAPAAPGPS
jgi:ABC-type molybdate transport system substrate-binding protein